MKRTLLLCSTLLLTACFGPKIPTNDPNAQPTPPPPSSQAPVPASSSAANQPTSTAPTTFEIKGNTQEERVAYVQAHLLCMIFETGMDDSQPFGMGYNMDLIANPEKWMKKLGYNTVEEYEAALDGYKSEEFVVMVFDAMVEQCGAMIPGPMQPLIRMQLLEAMRESEME